MAKLGVADRHVAVLLALFGLTVAVPADSLSEGIANPEYYDDDVFAPVSDKENFDFFDWQLSKQLSMHEPGNLVLSPISIKLMLAMLYEGAEGKTARELELALQLPSRIQARKKFSVIIESLLTKRPEYLIKVATKMYVPDDVHLKPRYSKILKYFYNASTEPLDFEQSRKAVQTINSWVSEVTEGRIKSMFSEDTINPSTVMLLVNAIYFKGLWRYPFNETETKDDVFFVTPTQSVTVPVMRLERDLYWTESQEMDAGILRLPYMGDKYSMFIVLPNKPDGLNKLLAKVNPALIKNQLFQMTKELVDVKLPKFRFEFTGELDGTLQALGVRDLFDGAAARLPGLARDKNLFVSKVIQKAGLEVNEKGTTAFASTGMELKNKFGGDIYFHATHPFLFFIQDETTGTVIFVGKLINPTEETMSLRTPEQPSVTGTQSQQGVLQSRFADEGTQRYVPARSTFTTPRSPKAPVPYTAVNDVKNDWVNAEDLECASQARMYLRNLLLRLQLSN